MTIKEPKTWHEKHAAGLNWREKLADGFANAIGSWGFIITQTVIIVFWVTMNVVGYIQHWDPYPFILLNLLFSTQAAFAAPIIMQSQNRQTQRDRHQALEDYHTNLKAKAEIEEIQTRLANRTR